MSRVKISDYLHKYYKQELHSLKKNLTKAKAVRTKKSLHKLRLDIKKLKALYRLIEKIYPEGFDAREHHKHYKKIFRIAGQIREAQLNKELIRSYNLSLTINKTYEKSLDKETKEGYVDLKKNIKKFHIQKIYRSKKELAEVYKGLTRERFNKGNNSFIINECKAINNFKKNTLTNANVHKIRKHLKNLGAITKLMYETKSEKVNKSLLDELKHTETLIGKWHDRIVLKDSLNCFLEEIKKPEDKREIQRVTRNIQVENRRLLQELKPKIDRLCNQFLGR